MDQEQVIRIAQEYTDLLLKNNFPIQKTALFGSYVNGKPTEDSDIDIAVVFDSLKEEQFFKISAMLSRLRISVDDRIEPVLFEKDEDDLSGFLSSILRSGTVIFDNQQRLSN